ncbi:MAG: magnesium transporter CorA family protein [Chloroflexota bacterium]
MAAADGTVRVALRTVHELVESNGLESVPQCPLPKGTIAWIDASAPSAEQITKITRLLGLHELIAEDILEGNQRAKIEVTDDRIHIVMFALRYGDPIEPVEIDMVLGDSFLLTVHAADWDPRGTHHLRGSGLATVMERGADHLLWAICDDLVDGYFPLMDKLGDEIDLLQDAVIANASPLTLERLFELKRELIAIRRATAPVREIFNQLTNRDLALVDAEEIVYFRDVYDHLIRLTDELDTYRELVSGTLDVYLSTVNNNLSLVMKRLTGITVVLASIGAFGGIFGMSEAGAAFGGTEAIGFWIVTAAIFGVAFVLAFVLRRIGWI